MKNFKIFIEPFSIFMCICTKFHNSIPLLFQKSKLLLSTRDIIITALMLLIFFNFFSLPKHKVSGQVKGFAFIEYSTTEEAKAALEVGLHVLLCTFNSTATTVILSLIHVSPLVFRKQGQIASDKEAIHYY